MSISVIIPTFNRAHLLHKSINSVLNQTESPLEIIIVDDFSTDNTEEVVKSFNRKELVYVKNKKEKGANGARNTGIQMAKGNYIAFQDSDDEWYPQKLEKQLAFMKKYQDVDMCFCSMLINNDPRQLIPKRNVDSGELKEQLLRVSFISTQTIFVKSKVAKDVLFDEHLKRLQDWDFCLRISKKYSIKHLPEPLVNVYLQNDSITKRVNDLEAMYILFRKHPLVMNSTYSNKSLYNKALFLEAYKQKKIKKFIVHFINYSYFKIINILYKLIFPKEREKLN